MRRGQCVCKIRQSVEMKGTRQPHPREYSECGRKQGTSMLAREDDQGHERTDYGADEGKPGGRTRQLERREVVDAGHRQACQELSSEPEAAQSHKGLNQTRPLRRYQPR